MAWDAGSVVGKITLDTSNYEQGVNKVQQKNQSMTGSFFKASLMYDLFKKGVSLVTDYLKDSVKAFAGAEIAEAKLRTQIKGSIETYKQFASEIQKVTTIEDDAVISAMSLAKAMGVADNKLKEVTTGAIGLSEAFGLELNQSIKLATLANQNNFDMLQRYIPALRTATTEAEKQAIVQKAMASGFEQAQAKAETFSGKLIQLSNAQGNLQEEFGKIIAVIGKDFVQSMIDGTNAVIDFITSAKGIEIISNVWGAIGGGFEVAKEIFGEIYNVLKEKVVVIFQNVIDKLKGLFKQGDMVNAIFFALAGATKIAGIAFGIVADVVKIIIDYNINLIKVIKEAVLVLRDFFKAMSNPFDPKGWEKVGDQVNKTWEAVKNLGKDLVTDVKDAVLNAWGEIKTLPEDTKKLAEELGKAWDDGFKKSKEKMATGLIAPPGGGGGGDTPPGDDPNKKTKETLSITIGLYENASNSISNIIGKMGAGVTNGMVNIAQNFKKGAENVGQAIVSIAETFTSVMSAALDLISEATNSYFENQLAVMEAHNEARLEKIEEQNELEKENIELQSEAEIEALNEKYNQGLISKTMYDEGVSEIERKKAANLEKTEKEYNKKMEKEKERAAKKEDQIKQRQFEANKLTTIANIWLQAGLGMIAVWPSALASGLPLPGAIALAAVATGIIAAMAIAQTAVVASQQYTPMKERGGMASGWVSMNERGGELAYLPDGSVVVPHDLSNQIAKNTVGSENVRNQTTEKPLLIQLLLDGKVLDQVLLDNQAMENIR